MWKLKKTTRFTPQSFATLENLHDDVDINRVWNSIQRESEFQA
jgi:hypothetical protein